MNEFVFRAEMVMEKIDELASISDDPNFISRIFGSKAFVEGCRKVLSWMKEAGLEARIDNIGNVRGKLTSFRNFSFFILHTNKFCRLFTKPTDNIIDAGISFFCRCQ